MIKLAVTGGIGSGKSYVSRMLEQRHIPVYDTDSEAKRLTASDPDIRAALTALIGSGVFQQGVLNKPLLAKYLFSDAAHAQKVNAIIHPRVRQDFATWAATIGEQFPIVAMESAILFEAGFQDTVDAVLLVYAPPALRLQRAMLRDGASEFQVRARMAAQMDDDEKRRRAHFVVVNDGIVPLEPQLDNLMQQLSSRLGEEE